MDQDQIDHYHQIAAAYLEGLNQGDEKMILDLFDGAGLVYSPLSGCSRPWIVTRPSLNPPKKVKRS